MINIELFDENKLPEKERMDEIVEFLYHHLEEYGDKKEYIRKCLNYALNVSDSYGGFVLTGYKENVLVGSVIVNKTGMGGYIPENILVYIATHRDYRGKGIGKELLRKTLELAEGDVKLHVEHDNPARFLYEKFGFANKYLEMRYKKEI